MKPAKQTWWIVTIKKQGHHRDGTELRETREIATYDPVSFLERNQDAQLLDVRLMTPEESEVLGWT